jgi:hypothetical protein
VTFYAGQTGWGASVGADFIPPRVTETGSAKKGLSLMEQRRGAPRAAYGAEMYSHLRPGGASGLAPFAGDPKIATNYGLAGLQQSGGHRAGMNFLRMDFAMHEKYTPFQRAGAGAPSWAGRSTNWLRANFAPYETFSSLKNAPAALKGVAQGTTTAGQVAGGVAKSAVGLGFRMLGPAFMGLSAYWGYQENGVAGAATGVATHLGASYVFGHMFGGGGVYAAAGIAGAVGFTNELGKLMKDPENYFSLRRMVRDKTSRFLRQHKGIELGAPMVDNFGNASTMRQRSVNAIMNSRLNGRTALGHEATLSYQPYFR